MMRLRHSCAWLLNSVLGHPRAILGAFGALMLTAGLATWAATPDYIMWPALAIVLAFVGSGASFVALVRPTRMLLALSGACLAGAVAGRAAGIAATLISHPWQGDLSWSQLIGGMAWVTFLVLLPGVWAKVLIPWAVRRAEGGYVR